MTMYGKLTTMDFLKMIWWGLWRTADKPLELPPLKKVAQQGPKGMAPETQCQHCKRPY